MNTADECRKRGIQVGDTIFGREEYRGARAWNEAKLYLIWLGECVAVWDVWTRSDAFPEWRHVGEQAGWLLTEREWTKIEPEAKP